mmetsp:Transcript_40487/g.86390  ORF Transcript_40487/g.86390 Transcript_40487/m.86390 type:complete len:94 (-) Transcript_40487:306-587(-)
MRQPRPWCEVCDGDGHPATAMLGSVRRKKLVKPLAQQSPPFTAQANRLPEDVIALSEPKCQVVGPQRIDPAVKQHGNQSSCGRAARPHTREIV